MGAEHDRAVGGAAAGLGEEVVGLALLLELADLQRDLGALGGVGGERLALGLGHATGRDAARPGLAEGAGEGALGVVVDDRADRARLGGGCLLLGEGAAPAFDQRDGALDLGGVVRGGAARGGVGVGRGVDQGRLEAALGSGGGVRHGVHRDVPLTGLDHGELLRQRLGVGEGEGLPGDLVVGLLHQLLDVRRRGLVAGRARRAVAVVPVGDRLELPQVAVGVVGRGLLDQLAGERRRVLARRRRLVAVAGPVPVAGCRAEQQRCGERGGGDHGHGSAGQCLHRVPSPKSNVNITAGGGVGRAERETCRCSTRLLGNLAIRATRRKGTSS